MKTLKELKVLTEEEVDTLYILQSPPGIQPDLEVFVVARRKGGVLLAVPLWVIPKKELDDGATSAEDLMVGPSKLITVPREWNRCSLRCRHNPDVGGLQPIRVAAHQRVQPCSR